MTEVLPQCARLLVGQYVGSAQDGEAANTILVLSRGDKLRVWPVHARRALRCATNQSTLPSRWTTTREVSGDLVEIRAVKGVVEETRW